MKLLSLILSVLAFLPAAGFVLFFAALSKWHTTTIGRSTMALSVSLALALIFPLFRRITGTPLPDSIGFVIFAFIIVALWWRFFELLRVQAFTRREARRELLEEVER